MWLGYCFKGIASLRKFMFNLAVNSRKGHLSTKAIPMFLFLLLASCTVIYGEQLYEERQLPNKQGQHSFVFLLEESDVTHTIVLDILHEQDSSLTTTLSLPSGETLEETLDYTNYEGKELHTFLNLFEIKPEQGTYRVTVDLENKDYKEITLRVHKG